jgi:predicted Zn finger-like uncharacterized protein
MILTCPDCATRYFVPDEKLGPQGRTVRCAGCGSSWKAAAEAPLDLVADEERAVAHEPKTFAEAASAEPVAPSLTEAPAAELPKILRAQAEEKKRKTRAAVAAGVWGVLGVAFAGLFGSAYLFRADVVEALPRAAGAYAAVGVSVNPVGLEFGALKATPTLHDGGPAITVSGVVRNVSDKTRLSPALSVALLDGEGKRLSATVLDAVHGPLRPGSEARFAAVLPDPGAKAADVDVRFALASDREGGAKPKAADGAKPVQHAAAANAPPALRPSLEPPGPAPVDAVPLAEERGGGHESLDGHGAGAVSAAPHG